MAVAATEVGGPHRRADAARNHQRLIDAAAEVFAARGLEATLDDIARHAGVNIATAYRHFANKHELAREFLRQCVDRARRDGRGDGGGTRSLGRADLVPAAVAGDDRLQSGPDGGADPRLRRRILR